MVGDDRGQLILVGAVAIALVLLGLVLVVNTALFTQVVGSEGTVETTREGGVSAESLSDSIGAIVANENHEAAESLLGSPSTSDIEDAVRDDLGPAFRNRALERGSSFVAVAYESTAETGAYVSQTDPNEFTSAAGASSWEVLNGSERSDVGGFVMVIDASQSANAVFTVGVGGSAGGSRDLEVRVNGAGDELDDLVVDGTTICEDVPATNDTIRIDVSDGRVLEDSSCQFDLFGPLEPGYAIRFDGGDEVYGTYEFATDNASLPLDPDARFNNALDGQPSRTNAIWSFEYSYEYDTGDAVVESDTREVDVYG